MNLAFLHDLGTATSGWWIFRLCSMELTSVPSVPHSYFLHITGFSVLAHFLIACQYYSCIYSSVSETVTFRQVSSPKFVICLSFEGKIKGGIEVTGRRGRERRKLLDDLKERRGYSHLKEEALDRTMWRSRFGRGFGPVVRQTIKWNECLSR